MRYEGSNNLLLERDELESTTGNSVLGKTFGPCWLAIITVELIDMDVIVVKLDVAGHPATHVLGIAI
jgi:hypothetical protein